MRVILKKKGFFGTKRTILNTKIVEIKPNNGNNDMNNKGLSIFFRDLEGSGVINLYPSEIEAIGKINWKIKEETKTPESSKKREEHILKSGKTKKTLRKQVKKKKR